MTVIAIPPLREKQSPPFRTFHCQLTAAAEDGEIASALRASQ
jgi:hypothetical protein